MTIRELIERLKEFDPELPVFIADWNEEYSPDHPLGRIIVEPGDSGGLPERLTLDVE